MLLYEHLSLSESDKDSTQFAHGLSKGARQPYQPSTVKLSTSNGRHKRTQSPCRNRPLARSARRYKGVIGESKEGIGGTRNPPCPPWPPEAPKIKGLSNAELANENQTLEIIERLTQGEYKSATKERSKNRRERTQKNVSHIQRHNERKRSSGSNARKLLTSRAAKERP